MNRPCTCHRRSGPGPGIAHVLFEWEGSHDFTDARDLTQYAGWNPAFDPANWLQQYPPELQQRTLIWRIRYRLPRSLPAQELILGGYPSLVCVWGAVRDGMMYRFAPTDAEPHGLLALHRPMVTSGAGPSIDNDQTFGFDVQPLSSTLGQNRPWVPPESTGRYNWTGEQLKFAQDFGGGVTVTYPGVSLLWRLEIGTVSVGPMASPPSRAGIQTWPQIRGARALVGGEVTTVHIPQARIGHGSTDLREKEYTAATWQGDDWTPVVSAGVSDDFTGTFPADDFSTPTSPITPWCVESEVVSDHGDLRPLPPGAYL